MAIIKTRPNNPFFTENNIPSDYFCDREEETRNIISLIENGNNVVITAPRRIGKSSLINHILKQPTISGKYYTLYVDIAQTQSPEDFISAVKASISERKYSSFPKRQTDSFESVTKEYSGKVGLKLIPLSMEASVRKEKKYANETTIDNIFRLFETAPKKCLIVFDEFQQVEKYEDKITALLRSKIQGLRNAKFIFSGSAVHMLNSMFTELNKPFYNSSSVIGLKRIPEDAYLAFCQKMFRLYEKDITGDAVRLAYELFMGNSMNIQQLMNRMFYLTEKNETATVESVNHAVGLILREKEDTYQMTFSRLKDNGQRQLVTCIALEGIASELMSAKKIKQYSLGPTSSIQNQLASLASEENALLTKIGSKAYTLSDKFFELWISREAGILDYKFKTVSQLYALNNKLLNNTPQIRNMAKGFQKNI